VNGNPVRELHARVLEGETLNKRIELIENFLLQHLSPSEKRASKIEMIGDIMNDLKEHSFFDNIADIASRYEITPRYFQKIFLQHTGLTPKLYSKIARFQTSLKLVTQKETSLTSIAFDCGYFDQSHFIKDFKSFTGYTPTVYSTNISPITFLTPNN
jgi:AraC-like DNA-binding protein